MASLIFLYLGLGTSMLGLACSVLAISSSLWAVIRFKVPFLLNDIGLMRHCDVESSYCGDMDRLNLLVDNHYEAFFRTVQAAYVLHCIGLLISLIMYILYTVRFLETKGGFRILTAFNFLTLAFGIYAVAVFGTNYLKFFGLEGRYPADASDALENHADLGRAFYMAITGCCFAFLIMMFSAMEASQAGVFFTNMQHRITVWSTPYTLFVDQDAA